MKNLILIISVACVFASCAGNNKNAATDTLAATPSTIEAKKLIQEFTPIIEGAWVKLDYIQEIARTKSPLKAAHKAGNITTFIFSNNNISGDSAIVAVGYGNHEGGELIFKFKSGRIPNSITGYDRFSETKSPSYVLQYTVKKDTLLTLYEYDITGTLLTTTQYYKAPVNWKKNELGYATYAEVNKILVTGNYTLTNSLGSSSQVSFSNEGKVKGLDDFKEFRINVDFIGELNNLDKIIFGEFGHEDVYNFVISKDTLKLFETSYSADSVELIKGNLKYKLIRQK